MARRPADSASAHPAAANTNGVLFWPVVVFVVVADLLSKAVAAYALTPAGFPHAVAGEWLRLTLVYNQGAAFGLHLGPWSRGIFLVLTVVVLRIIWGLYRATPDRANARVLALALLAAGATGNAITRVLSEDGVVDFLDIGFGRHRWPTFNVADIAVTLGAILLFHALWGSESPRDAAEAKIALGSTPAGVA